MKRPRPALHPGAAAPSPGAGEAGARERVGVRAYSPGVSWKDYAALHYAGLHNVVPEPAEPARDEPGLPSLVTATEILTAVL